MEVLRLTMQAETSLRLEVGKALSDAQREARSLQISLHDEECALTRCSGDLVKEMTVASKIHQELHAARADSAQTRSTWAGQVTGETTRELQQEVSELRWLESNADLEAQRWKTACRSREEELE